MPDEKPELVGKKKLIVDDVSFFHLASSPTETVKLHFVDNRDSIAQTDYFSGNGADKVRIVLGKNWDFKSPIIQPPGAEDLPSDSKFSSDWAPLATFANGANSSSPFSYEICEPEVEMTGETGGVFRLQRITLKADVTGWDVSSGQQPDWLFRDWQCYVKTGIISETGKSYSPIIDATKGFSDHYHESINPFTPVDLVNKQPVGKTCFAKYKTYYNERFNFLARSAGGSNFESTTGNLKLHGGGTPYIQNALPSIYSFLRLFVNKDLMENSLFDLSELTSYNLDPKDPSGYYLLDQDSQELKNVYKTLLKNFTLETLLTLYGVIGRTDTFANFDHSKIIEKIVSTSFDNIDADSLFSDYFNEYTKILTDSNALKSPEHRSRNRMRALERMMTNLVFSPNTIKLLNKVDQYKKHFPFYAELEFTANLDTEIGDAMKELQLTKFISEVALSSTDPPESDLWHDSWTVTGVAGTDFIQQPKFISYSEEDIHTDLGGKEIESEQGALSTGTKKTIDIKRLTKTWISSLSVPGIYSDDQGQATVVDGDPGDFSFGDLRNYFTFFRSDYSDPVNLDSDENFIFKKLLGNGFYGKLLDVYNKERRTYEEIINGKPAYTEDLFYRIEKIRKLAGSDEEEVVQNILIPNTSELDIVKYVDTQLKYATYATYKYNVYAHRVVFGSQYKYYWCTQDCSAWSGFDWPQNQIDASGITPSSAGGALAKLDQGHFLSGLGYNTFSTMQGDTPHGPIFGGAFHANLMVKLEPSIVLLEDKIFSTPDIIILDKPPVIPDINIVPYRAVNNRIKILMTGASDRYRAKPVIMLESDEDEFDRIIAAQLSLDGKVEFGSDDPVKTFQIFRVQKKPSTYADFELYDQVTQEVYEEQILPNTKYYYTFRVIDDHGHVSNPTPVYEVELIDEKGAVKPIIRLVDMVPPKNKTNTKDCQKYIYLKPALKQLYFSDDPEVDSIFSESEQKKKYKMRLTSKGSGKKIDINFSFKKKLQPE